MARAWPPLALRAPLGPPRPPALAQAPLAPLARGRVEPHPVERRTVVRPPGPLEPVARSLGPLAPLGLLVRLVPVAFPASSARLRSALEPPLPGARPLERETCEPLAPRPGLHAKFPCLHHLLSSWIDEQRTKTGMAHLAGFEPALSSSQNWCFRGRTRIRSLVESCAPMVMPWKAIESVGRGREVHVWSRLPVKLQVHAGVVQLGGRSSGARTFGSLPAGRVAAHERRGTVTRASRSRASVSRASVSRTSWVSPSFANARGGVTPLERLARRRLERRLERSSRAALEHRVEPLEHPVAPPPALERCVESLPPALECCVEPPRRAALERHRLEPVERPERLQRVRSASR